MRQSALAIVLLLAACARSEDASVTVDPNSAQAVERVRTPQADDGDMAIGEWRDALQDDRPVVEFGPAGAPAIFSVRCDDRGGVNLQRHGTVPVGDLPMMLVTVGNDTTRLAVTTASGAIPMLRSTINPNDPFLETFAEGASAMTIRIGDSAPLVLPPNPNFGTFVAGCASGSEADGGDANAAGADQNAAAPAEEANASANSQ